MHDGLRSCALTSHQHGSSGVAAPPKDLQQPCWAAQAADGGARRMCRSRDQTTGNPQHGRSSPGPGAGASTSPPRDPPEAAHRGCTCMQYAVSSHCDALCTCSLVAAWADRQQKRRMPLVKALCQGAGCRALFSTRGWCRAAWEGGVTPGSVIRAMGPWGSGMVHGYARRRRDPCSWRMLCDVMSMVSCSQGDPRHGGDMVPAPCAGSIGARRCPRRRLSCLGACLQSAAGWPLGGHA